MKLWDGRFNKATDKQLDEFNASIGYDKRLYQQDILGSIAHATMLGKQDIILQSEADKIITCLKEILVDIENNKIEFSNEYEDIHMLIENELIKRIGETGKRLHTARSRNDQIVLDFRMYLKKEINQITDLLISLIKTILEIAKQNLDTIMPAYTHLQRAQPTTFAHYVLAYGFMFKRDINRIWDCYKRVNIMPLGSGALTGTTHNIDRKFVADYLGFFDITENSIDAVSDRDFAIELLNALSIIMMHLSRFSEEIILWSSWEFKFIELDDAFTTGSSIMPQKKNPDVAELVRGKTGRVYGSLMGLLTTMKGLPLAYNKDMQEDKEQVFDAIDTTKNCIGIFDSMLKTMKTIPQNMLHAANKGFINATDCADYLVRKGLPFRQAYTIVGKLVNYCIANDKTLETLSLQEYQNASELFDAYVYDAISLLKCINQRKSAGGSSINSVNKQIEQLSDFVNKISFK